MNIEKKILEIYEEINNSKKSLREAALDSPLDKVSVNSPFGKRGSGDHNGVDLAADAAEVKSPADGVVEIGAIKDAFLVPVRAISNGMITVRRKGKWKKEKVNIGHVDGMNVEILDGKLSTTDQILIKKEE